MRKKILFVDDEPMILQGIRRMLRGMRDEWNMEFSQGGRETLEIMTKKSFDVIVSDMRMPEMDGGQLLSKVKEQYPQTVRIILSGHSDKEAILRTVKLAHQYLSKPCDADILKATISRSCALRDFLAQDDLKQLVSQMESLPALPALYTELVDLLKSPDVPLQKIGEVIAKDLGMTAKILQLVNSAFFGIPRHVSSPSQAVSLLGLDTVKALVLTIGIFSKFDKNRILRLGIEGLWAHSLRTGAIAKGIAAAEGMHKNQVGDALMGGLLHDVGKLILAANIPDKYSEILEQARAQKVFVHETEKMCLGGTHAEVGAYLAGLWGLPESIVEVIAFHHCPNECPAKILSPLSIVHVANGLEQDPRKLAGEERKSAGIDWNYAGRLGLEAHIPNWQKVSLRIKEER
jgi:HD-like signal output (HDOD) protein